MKTALFVLTLILALVCTGLAQRAEPEPLSPCERVEQLHQVFIDQTDTSKPRAYLDRYTSHELVETLKTVLACEKSLEDPVRNQLSQLSKSDLITIIHAQAIDIDIHNTASERLRAECDAATR